MLPASSPMPAVQAEAWRRLWDTLLAPADGEPAAPDAVTDEPQAEDERPANEAA